MEAPNTQTAPRSPEHVRYREYRVTTLAAAQREVQAAIDAANRANAEVQQLEAVVAAARERVLAASLRGDREAWRAAKLDAEFDEHQLEAARERAAPVQAAYADAAARFNNGPVVEAKGLLAGALLTDVSRIAAELDTALNEHIAPKLQLLGAIKAWFIRERIPGVGMQIIDGARVHHEKFMSAVNSSAPGSEAEAELKALIDALNA